MNQMAYQTMKYRAFATLQFNWYNWLLYFATSVYLIFQFPLALLRISGGSQIAIPIVNGYLLLFVGLGLFQIFFRPSKLLYAPVFLNVSIAFLGYIFLLGLINDNNNVTANLRYFFLGLAIYCMVSGTIYYRKIVSSLLLWQAVLLMHVVGYAFYYVALKGSTYPGIGVQTIGYAVLFFVYSGHPVLAAISVLLIILEQKRSILISTFVTIILLYFWKKREKFNIGLILKVVTIVMMVGAVALYLISNLAPSPIVNRINLLNPFSPEFAPLLGSSGRLGEIESFFGKSDTWSLFIGLGSGFEYIWDLGYSSDSNGELKNYFHGSIINYVAAGGVFGLAYFVFVASLASKIYKAGVDKSSRNIITSFGIFSLIQSSFGFSSAVDPFFWITILAPVAMIAVARRKSLNFNRTLQFKPRFMGQP